MEKENLKKCRNCYYEVKKGIRRCPYCGIVNPTLELKEVFVMTLGVIAVLIIYSYLFPMQ